MAHALVKGSRASRGSRWQAVCDPEHRRHEHILLALLEPEDGTGVLTDLGVDKATAEADIIRSVAATLAAHQPK
jgi:hypothetical protein